MFEKKGVRWGWLRIMYIWTIVIAGAFGLGIIFAPNMLLSKFNNICDPVTYGVNGSVFLAFALLSILGLRAPLRFVPILLLQLTYKAVWLVGVALPLVVGGKFPADAIMMVVIFALTVVGDVIAIPFPHVFAKQSDA